jgi:hypothetical protein
MSLKIVIEAMIRVWALRGIRSELKAAARVS